MGQVAEHPDVGGRDDISDAQRNADPHGAAAQCGSYLLDELAAASIKM